jgi:hypothetical protein
MNPKNWLDIVIIPIMLALIAICWPVIQNYNRRRIFKQLIFRELREISPFPQAATLKGWWEHCQKRFIHREIFLNPTENRDFILSLELDLVYFVTQLWHSLEKHDFEQWDYCLDGLSIEFRSSITTPVI